MIQISEPEESESFSKNNPIIHYRFNRKFDFLDCHSQLYISNSKLKIIINCKEEYSKEIKTYSNSFTLYDLQNISKYFNFFSKIEDVLEDIATVFNQCNYEVEKSGNKLNTILHVDINEEILDIKLKLDLVKNLQDNNNRNKKVIYYNPKKTEEFDAYRNTKNSSHNVGVKSMNDLNNILTDLKDRLTVLEVTQNTSNNNQPGSFMNKNARNRDIGYGNNLNMGSKSFGGNYNGNYNENILLSMESILKRIAKLEEKSQMKSDKIQELKEKLKIYEPTITATSENDSIYDNNTFKFNNNNYNYNNINDFNNINQNQKYINLGSIRNIDTSTITSNNSYMNKELLEIKEEELNNSNKKNKKKQNSSDEESSKQIENNNMKKIKNKTKGKKKTNKRKNKSVDKLRKDDDDDELKKPQNKKISKNKSVDRGKNNMNNLQEEIINTDIIKEKKKPSLKKSFSNVNVNTNNINDSDSQKMINNMEKNLIQNNKRNTSIIKSKKSKQFENNNDNNINNNNNYIKKKSAINKDNNDDDNINNINNNEEIKNNIEDNNYYNKINTIYNNDNNEENKDNNNINKEPIFKFSHSINNNDVKINNINNNSSNHQNSNENNSDSSKEKEEKIAKFLEKKKELELEQEIEEKEEKKRRQKAFMDSSSQESSLKVKQIHKSLTMVPKEDIRLYCKSRIIFTKKELKLLKDKINQDKKKYSVFFDVLYRASEDGANVDIVKKIMEKQKRTLTLFQTEKGARFGIFVEKKLDTSILMTQYLAERTGTCFLISLNNLEVYYIYKNYTSSENKLCFIKNKKKNRNGSSYAIYTPPKDFLGKECYMGDLTAFFKVDGNEDIIGEKEEYKLKEVEVCKVSIEKRSNEVLKNEILKAKTEIPKKGKGNETKHSYGREYSFGGRENGSGNNDEQEFNENDAKKQYNQEEEERISNKLKYDYYDWGIINGKNDKK